MKGRTPKHGARVVEPGGLTVSSRAWAGGTVVALRGELDLDTVDPVRAALDEALATRDTTVVIDCGELEFCDSTGLNVMLHARALADAGGSRVEIARPRPLLLRMLDITAATDAFRIRDDVPQ
ncbi:STAS domain-containing protein [Kitasatospora sp. NBC_01560]|uniref:STAS domain-containing protein n=1 Tax=Kitasatospora sp. NBC_01560 TaxID=2975965 RepID=UPI003863A919